MAPPGDRRAANDTSWRIRAVASVAVLGLATLLFLQFERGTPEEREIAMSPSPGTAPAAGPAHSTAPTAQAPAMEQPAAPQRPVTAEVAVPAQRPPDIQAPVAPIKPKVALADKAGAKPGPSDSASTLGHGPASAPQPVERGSGSDGASARDSPIADSAALSGMAGPGLPAGAMKAAPQNLEARSRAPQSPAPSAGRDADVEGSSPAARSPAPSSRLLAAAHSGALEAARQALKDGAPVNAADASGQTPLMLAARHGDEAMLRLLLAAGADRTRTDTVGLTAADQARRAGHETLLPLLDPPESQQPAPQR